MVRLNRPEGPEPVDLNLSRRAAAGLMFAGYALAAVSAEAEPIHTDEQGLVTGMVEIHPADRALPAYLARPAAPGRHPAVVVISEVFGLHEYIRDVCRRLAKQGYAAIAPAFFVRVGDPAPLTDMDAIWRIVNAASDAQVMGDVGAAIKFLQAQPFVDAKRLAVTGFCWGGGEVWLACETFPQLKAGVSWYGRLAPGPNAPAGPGKLWPLERVKSLKAPVLGLYGGKDPLSQAVPAMREALRANGDKSSDIVIYPDAGHGFHADYRPSYNAADAQDGWRRMLAFFAEHGVAAGKT